MKVSMVKMLRVAAFAILSVVVVSCGGKKKKDTPPIAKDTLKAELEEIAYPLPSPFEVTDMINEIEAAYIIGLSNEVDAYKRYLTDDKQALNLGVYSSDMAYATTYRRTEVTQEYLTSVIELVKELDLTGAVDRNTPDKIEASLDSKEKSIEVLTDLFYNTYSYMNKNNDTELSYLILAGTWIEGMYLTTNVSDNTANNLEILKIIVKQEDSLSKLLDLMKQFSESEDTKPIYDKLVEIQKIYQMEEGTTSITVEELETMTKLIADLRAEIIK